MARYTAQGEVVQVNVKLERDAKMILDRYAPGPKAHGRFLGRLLYEFQARQEVRGDIRKEVQAALEKTV
jgi:hypothetical protein